MNESEITCVNLKRTMMERLCAISEIGASYLVSKRYVQELHYQQGLSGKILGSFFSFIVFCIFPL